MADFADLGSARADQMLEEALEAQRRASARSNIDHVYCLDCDIAIPVKRREALPGVETCVDCQTLREPRRG